MRTWVRVLSFIVVALALAAILFSPWRSASQQPEEPPSPPAGLTEAQKREQLNTQVRQYLESKNSPLAPDTEYLTELPHWELLIAISAIESQYCKRQLGFNCWGIGGDSAYRYYDSYRAAAQDASDLITRWQEKGRWLTVEDMNCHYVQPCNQNWVTVVNLVLSELNALTGTGTSTPIEDAK